MERIRKNETFGILRESSNLKNRKGITLIALVITIIVLLILAGVTIVTLTGDNRIITKSGRGIKKIRNRSRQRTVDFGCN